MTRSRRLKPVVRLWESKELDLVWRLVQARQQWQAQQARIEELKAYRSEYEDTLRAESVRGMSAIRLRHFQGLLDRLAEAIASQSRCVEELERNFEEIRTAWLAMRQRRSALGKVAERYARAEREALKRIEQREIDACPRKAIRHED